MAWSFYSMEIVFLVIANDSTLISSLSLMHEIAPFGQLAASSFELINFFYESSSKALIIDRKYYLRDSTRRAVDLHWRLSFYRFLLTDNSPKSSNPLSIGRLLFWKFSIRRSSRKYYENNFSYWAWVGLNDCGKHFLRAATTPRHSSINICPNYYLHNNFVYVYTSRETPRWSKYI